MDLVIMAAGMGSRFGGLKQLEPMDDYGNFIIDFSVYDAIKCGFDKIVFIIKSDKEFLDVFNNTIKKRMDKLSHLAKFEYVYQDMDKFVNKNLIPEGRTKPWGTAHAILCCKDVVKDSFTIINADDFYGYDAFKVASDYIQNEQTAKNKFGLIAYEVKNTLSEKDAVKRGVCEAKDGKLLSITESSILKTNGIISATPLDERLPKMNLTENTLVSMNMWSFTPIIFEELETGFRQFLINDLPKNPLKAEYLIPEVVDQLVKQNKVTVDIKSTTAKWYGVTYKDDKIEVVNAINDMKQKGIYPERLWN